MTSGLDPTIGRGRLRQELRNARMKLRLSQLQVAEALGWSESKIIRIEGGKVGISQTDLQALLSNYGITDSETVAGYIRLARASRRQAWSEYRDVLNPEFLVYLGYESSASAIQKFDLVFIPGLLQTEAYARWTIWTLAKPSTSEIVKERQLKVRLARQGRLQHEDALSSHFIIDETAIRRGIGGGPDTAMIMREQLQALLDVASHSWVTLQIVPLNAGMHSGLTGPFTILQFPDDADEDLLYLENSRQSMLTRDHVEEIDRYRDVFVGLQKIALDADRSLKLIESLVRDTFD